MKKKLLLAALLAPLSALAQTYPSPTFSSITLQTPLAAASGGTGTSTSTGSGSLVLSSAPTIANPTFTGSFTATGLVGISALAAQAANTVIANATGASAAPAAFAMPSCSSATSALQWTSGTGFSCNTGSAPLASPTFTGTVTIPSGASISGYLTSATAASTYAPLASPAMTGTPTAPTATAGTSTTQIATTAFVGSAITGIATSTFGALYLAWFNSLPTTLPASAGVLWNNSGVLSKS